MNITTRELYNRAAAAADMHDGFVTPAQAMYWASQENLALALFLARSGWTQNVLTETITVDGTEDGEFELTADPLAIVCIHQSKSNGYRLLRHNNYVDFLRQAPGSSLTTGDPVEWIARHDQEEDAYVLNFYPEPPSGTVLIVSYVPEPERLTLSENPTTGYTNSVNYPMGWEERVVLGMARKALAKEESDTRDILDQIAECDARISSACWDFALAESPTIRNVDKATSWGRTISYPPSTQWVFL